MMIRKSVRAGITSLVIALAAIGGSSALAGPTGPGNGAPTAPTDAQRVVGRNLRAIGHVTHEACEDIRRAVGVTVGRIARLDRHNGTEEQIIAAGQESIARITERAGNAIARIETIKTNALAALTAANGTEEQAQRLTDAAAAATARVTECRDNAVERINAAVERANGGG